MKAAENTTTKQRGRPFEKGRSANPAGRPRGARNHATIIAEALLDGEAAALTRKVIEKAKGGDPVCLRLCMERLLPPRRDRPVRLELPPIETAADAAKAMGKVLTSLSHGDISPADAETFAKLIETWMRSFEATEIERRLRALEQGQ